MNAIQAKRGLLALLFILAMTVSMLPMAAFAASEATIVFAASDYQSVNGQDAKKNMTAIVKRVARDHKHVDGTLFAGDYATEKNADAVPGIEEIKGIFSDVGWEGYESVWCQGNHDRPEGGFSSFGEHDTEAYGVFLINEDNFPQDRELIYGAVVQGTAAELKEYLDKKHEIGYRKPIFVLSHLPLHATNRGDNGFGNLLVEVLNDYDDLTIFYLFGHNHSSKLDTGIGYNTFLTRGDVLRHHDGTNRGTCDTKLNFTYMNAGYIGNHSAGTLSATVFKITEDKVVVYRYRASGQTQLKSAGKDREPAGYQKTYSSPQTIKLGVNASDAR